jgi:hypothetical protein
MWITFLGFIPNFIPKEPIFLETFTALKFIHLITPICFIVTTRLEENIRIQSMLKVWTGLFIDKWNWIYGNEYRNRRTMRGRYPVQFSKLCLAWASLFLLSA